MLYAAEQLEEEKRGLLADKDNLQLKLMALERRAGTRGETAGACATDVKYLKAQLLEEQAKVVRLRDLTV